MNFPIEVNRISKKFHRGPQALSDVSFHLQEGEILGLLGPNGSGKSTLMKIMLGLLPPSEGTVTFFGNKLDVIAEPVRDIGVLLDPNWLDKRLDAVTTIKVQAALVNNEDAFDNPLDVLAKVGLEGASTRKITRLSLGMRQRLALAVALISDPKILILDEPINGLDPDGILAVREILQQFRNKGGSVLLSSHLMTEMQVVADRVVILKKGHVLVEGPIDQLGGQSSILFSVLEDASKLISGLAAGGINVSSSAPGEFEAKGVDAATIFKFAVDSGVTLTNLQKVSPTLEDSYTSLTA